MAIAFRSATEAGTGSAATSLVISVPSGVADDDLLLLYGVTADGDDGGFDALSGWTQIVNNVEVDAAAPSPPGTSVWWRVAASEPANYTITPSFGSTGICAQMLAFTGVDTTTPIDVTTTTATGDSSNADPPSIDYADANATIVVSATWDANTGAYTSVPTNYTSPDTLGDVVGVGGGNGCELATAYDLTPAADPENPGAYTSGSEQWMTSTVALREGATGPTISTVTPDPFDMDTASVTVAGTGFQATIGSSDVYLSPNDLLSEAGEVDITAAVNTWSDTSINLDLTQLSQATLDSLHTMGPGARFVIVNVGGVPATDEVFKAVTLHRPQAFQMVLGNIVPGGTTSRLTGMTGTFGGGRAEETAAQNPSTTTVDIASNGNREDVWSIEAKLNSVDGDQYDFRVLYGGVVADTITQTPQVTISGQATQALTTVLATTAVGTVTASNDGSAALTTVLTTAAVGLLTAGLAVDVTGEEVTAAVGTVTQDVSVTLTGVVGTSDVGTVSGDHSYSLSGVVSTGDVGLLDPAITIDLTGEEATSAVGTVTENHSGSAATTGVEATVAVGSVGFTESGNVGLTGVESTTSVGTLDNETRVDLTGIAATVAIGILNSDNIQTLTGEEATTNVGTLDNETRVDLTGVEATIAVGTVEASSGGTQALTGIEATAAIGNVGFTKSGSAVLTGVEATTNVGTLDNETRVDLTGVEATIAVGTVEASSDGTQALTGIEATAAVGSIGFTESGNVGLTGVEATTSVGTLDNETRVDLTGVEATVAVGTLNSDNIQILTGEEVTVAVGILNSDNVQTLTGIEATVAVENVEFTKSGSVVLTGVEATSDVGSVGASSESGATLIGVVTTSAVGNIGFTKSGSVGLTGVEATGSVDTLDKSNDIDLIGVEATVAVGTLNSDNVQALTGVEATVAVGNISFTESGSVRLTGVNSTAAIGSVNFTESGTVALNGVSSTVAVGSIGFTKSGSAALIGVESTTSVDTLDKSNDVDLIGEEATTSIGTLDNKTKVDLTGVTSTSNVGILRVRPPFVISNSQIFTIYKVNRTTTVPVEIRLQTIKGDNK